MYIITDSMVGMTTSQKAPCPTQHLHGDTHALFCHYGHKWCPCEVEALRDSCDHNHAIGDTLTGVWECMVCDHTWVE